LIKEFGICVNEGNKLIQEINPNYKLVIESCANFKYEDLNTEHALTIGCSSDYNVWTRSENPKINLNGVQERWAGGHIHIGFENPTTEKIDKIVKTLDMFLAIPFTIIDPNDNRKRVYGTAGRFRFTPYGLEYRVLSNYWLSSNELIDYVFNQLNSAFQYLNDGYEPMEEVVSIINNIEKENALSFCNIYNINVYDAKRKETKYDKESV
jgi:hypothetical protein